MRNSFDKSLFANVTLLFSPRAMSKTALLFAGQGAQTVGMGKDLADAFPTAGRLFDQANEAVGYDLARVCTEGPKDELTKTSWPEGCVLFTADAQSMYTNIATDLALDKIASYLRENEHSFPDTVHVEPLISALELVMRHNVFSFGDTW